MAGLGACPLHREGSVLPPAPPAPPAPDRMPAGGGHDCPLPAGENVKAFFSRVAALAFERSVLQDLERRSSSLLQVGGGDVIRKCRAPGLGRDSRPTSASTTLCWDSTVCQACLGPSPIPLTSGCRPPACRPAQVPS